MLALALLLFSAGVAVHLEEVEGVSGKDAQAIAESLAQAIHTRTGSVAVVDDPVWACDAEDRCLEAIRARTRADAVVYLRVFGGPASVRLNAEVVRARESREAKLSVARAGINADVLAPIAAELFAAGKLPSVVLDPTRAAAADRVAASSSIVPWIVLAGSVVAAGAGVGFGVSALNAESAAETLDHPGGETDRLLERQRAHGIASLALFSGAVAGAIVSLLWWVVPEFLTGWPG